MRSARYGLWVLPVLVVPALLLTATGRAAMALWWAALPVLGLFLVPLFAAAALMARPRR